MRVLVAVSRIAVFIESIIQIVPALAHTTLMSLVSMWSKLMG